MKTAIIGGGITGLSALYELEKHGIDAHLFEASEQLGGKVRTHRRDGFIIERGADSFLARKPELMDLVKELGMEDRLVPNEIGQAFIFWENEFHPIPKGSVMGVPGSLSSISSSSLLNPFGKARAALDLWIPKDRDVEHDRSAGDFFRKRFGNQMVDRLLEPLLSGIYAGNLKELSLKSTLPLFYDLAKDHKSLIKASGHLQQKRQGSSNSKGQFRTFKNGLSEMIDALEKACSLERIHKNKELVTVVNEREKTKLIFSDASHELVDHVILTVPHDRVSDVLPNSEMAQEMKEMKGSSIATVALAYKEEDVRSRVNGTGFLVPRANGTNIKAMTFVDKKWPHAVPKGYVLLRCFVGRPGDEQTVHTSDEGLKNMVQSEISEMLDVKVSPIWIDIERWKEAMPKYSVGHGERVKDWKRAVQTVYPTVQLAGASYEGVGLPDCVRQGQMAAKHVLQQISER